MSKQLRLDVAQLTDVGRKRPHNEDNMAYVIPKDPQVLARKGALFIVADGMGGHAAGEVASEIAVDTISNVYYQDASDNVAASLYQAIKQANTSIHQRSAENMLRSGMGTTCVAAVLRGDMSYIANVGDSRAYIVRHGQARQVSQDHSWVAEQVRAGLLTEDQARSHAQRNVITRCLGTQSDVEVDVFPEPLEEGDSIILCTDGLSGLVSDDELRSIVEQYVPQESVYHLVERANENGGSDNITAIVVRVQEVGQKSSDARQPVYPGGHESIEDAATLSLFPTVSFGRPSHATQDRRIPSAPLQMTSGPLGSPDMVTSPQPALRMPRRRSSRLFYPTLAVFVVLVVALLGGSAYFVFHFGLGARVNVDQSLTLASNLVLQASREVATEPISALRDLSFAQNDLHDVQGQGATLNAQQSRQLADVESNLVENVKTAITAYNRMYLITPLPCPNMPINTIPAGNPGIQVSSIARAQDGKGDVFLYALGKDDHKLYQINTQQNTLSPFTFPGTQAQPPDVVSVTGDGSRLLALTRSNTTQAQYTLHVLVPQTPDGALKDLSAAQIDSALTNDGHVPSFLTAWGQDAYVVLTATTSPTTVKILDYMVNSDKGTQGNKPSSSTISITAPLVGIAAFPHGQLFLLQGNGSLQSLQFAGSTQTAVNVVVDHPIAMPLAVSAELFTPTTPVPVAGPLSSAVLSLPGQETTMLLAAGQVGETQHLYIEDGPNSRILDLKVVNPLPANTTSTPATAGGNTAATAAAGNPVTMELQRQYASSSLLAHVHSMVVDPKASQLELLGQNSDSNSQQSLSTLDVNPLNPDGCPLKG